MYRIPDNLDDELKALEESTADFLAGRLEPTAYRARRVPHGVYEQRREGTYMVRIRCAAGFFTPRQLNLVAHIAQEEGAPFVHITTRQELQIHDVKIERLIPILHRLKVGGLSSRGGGGNTLRNITASPDAGILPGEPFDVSPQAFALTTRLIAEGDSWILPRKYKIAFSNTEEDTAQAAFHDVGFFAKVRDGRRGFKVLLAGGFGAKAAVGVTAHDFLPESNVYLVAKAVKTLFLRHGNPRNKHHSRLRFLRQDLGDAEFLSLYRRILDETLAAGPAPLDPWTVPGTSDPEPTGTGRRDDLWRARHVRPQKQEGLFSVFLPIPLGILTVDQALLLASTLEPFGEDVMRGTRDQNILVRNIPERHLDSLLDVFHRVAPESAKPSLHGRAVSCTGADTCKLGICLPKPALTAVLENLGGSGLDLDKLGDFRLNLSGCPNSCGNHWGADLGFFGKAARKGDHAFPAYQVVAGAQAGPAGAELAKPYGVVAARNLPAFVRDFLSAYLSEKERFGTLREYLQAEGGAALEELCRKHQDLPEFADSPDHYRDWGREDLFSLAGRGQGECSAGMYDMIESDLKQVRELAKGAPEAAALKELVRLSCRMLLVTRGVEARSEGEAHRLFLEHFVDKGLVPGEHCAVIEAAGRGEDLVGRREAARAFAGEVEDLYSRMDNSFRFAPKADAVPAASARPVSPADAAESAAAGEQFKDLRGVACPMNFVKTKMVLDGMAKGERLRILLDDGPPIENVPRSVEGEGHRVLEQVREGAHWSVRIEKRP